MDHKLSRMIFNIGLGVVIILALLGGVFEKLWLCWSALGIFAADLIQQMLFDRCPDCGEWFNFRAKEPDFCPRCGKNLKENKE